MYPECDTLKLSRLMSKHAGIFDLQRSIKLDEVFR